MPLNPAPPEIAHTKHDTQIHITGKDRANHEQRATGTEEPKTIMITEGTAEAIATHHATDIARPRAQEVQKTSKCMSTDIRGQSREQ